MKHRIVSYSSCNEKCLIAASSVVSSGVKKMQQSLIPVAHELFVHQGYEATMMQQIVREADTSIGNCYFYFSIKEALLRAVVADFTIAIGRAIDITIAPLPPGPEQLAVRLTRAVRATLSQAELARVLLVEPQLPELRFTVLHYFLLRLSFQFALTRTAKTAYAAEEIKVL